MYDQIDKLLTRIEEKTEHLPESDYYLTSEDMINWLSLSERSLVNYRQQRIIPYTRIGKKYLYPLSEIKQILDENKIPALKRF